MSRHLPLAGARPDSVAPPDYAPVPLPRPSLVIAAVRDEGPAFRFASAFAQAFEGDLDLLAAVEADHFSDREWELEGRQGRRIFGPLAELREPFLQAATGSSATSWLLIVGAPAALLVQASLSIRLTGGLSPIAWRPLARGFPANLDLVDPREGVAKQLAAHLAAR